MFVAFVVFYVKLLFLQSLLLLLLTSLLAGAHICSLTHTVALPHHCNPVPRQNSHSTPQMTTIYDTTNQPFLYTIERYLLTLLALPACLLVSTPVVEYSQQASQSSHNVNLSACTVRQTVSETASQPVRHFDFSVVFCSTIAFTTS
uniref:Uncharacterized protein n=1 Tax=Bactrocera latifrons TaxID=174628 RepID=A0A0K8TY15_BACLA